VLFCADVLLSKSCRSCKILKRAHFKLLMVQSYNTLLAEGAISISSRPQSASTSRARIDAANKVPGGADQACYHIMHTTEIKSNPQHVSHPCSCRCQGVCQLSVRCWRHPGWPAGLPGCGQTPRITATRVSHVSFRQPKVPAAASASSSGELSWWPQYCQLIDSVRDGSVLHECQVLYSCILISTRHLGLPGNSAHVQHVCMAWH